MLPAAVLSPPVEVHTLLASWQTGALSFVLLAVEVLLAAWYLVSVRRLAARGRTWPRARTVSFLSGLVVMVVALQSGLAVEGDRDFWVYVIQHLLLMNFVPILLALSAPVTLALQASGRPTQRALLAVLHHPVVELLTHPLVVAAAVYVTMLVYFLSPFYNLALEHSWLRDLVFLHFLVSGYLFWWILIGRDPSRWRLSHPAKLGLLAPGIAVNAILGVSLTGATTSVAPHFQTLGDTHVGGSILWVVGELISLVAMGLVLYQWMQFEERQAVRADRRTDAEEGRAAVERGGAGHLGATASPAHNGSSGASADP